eukprot:Blabericola_migrator_1__313@NODE_1080_length_5498_cov_189_077702_g570_i1_p2_GENE_NODE_1080_length_5498_cov_189_077702_g570_i1NODE_1080_length_5498_cov_189_077702_g570_i1_p2_ORF_typecomplete_len223_score9_76FliD_N/PF02465_18/0_064_NODE_1080_length_5498_cov_189_077702_g570_i148105478
MSNDISDQWVIRFIECIDDDISSLVNQYFTSVEKIETQQNELSWKIAHYSSRLIIALYTKDVDKTRIIFNFIWDQYLHRLAPALLPWIGVQFIPYYPFDLMFFEKALTSLILDVSIQDTNKWGQPSEWIPSFKMFLCKCHKDNVPMFTLTQCEIFVEALCLSILSRPLRSRIKSVHLQRAEHWPSEIKCLHRLADHCGSVFWQEDESNKYSVCVGKAGPGIC